MQLLVTYLTKPSSKYETDVFVHAYTHVQGNKEL